MTECKTCGKYHSYTDCVEKALAAQAKKFEEKECSICCFEKRVAALEMLPHAICRRHNRPYVWCKLCHDEWDDIKNEQKQKALAEQAKKIFEEIEEWYKSYNKRQRQNVGKTTFTELKTADIVIADLLQALKKKFGVCE